MRRREHDEHWDTLATKNKCVLNWPSQWPASSLVWKYLQN
jgi:hypothetical protein